MFDFGMGELLLIGVVALIVVGPKDLPVLFRQVGNFVGKARAMGREFSSAMNQAARESGMEDVKSSLQGATDIMKTAANPVKGTVNALAEHAKVVTDIDPDSETGKLAAKRAEDAQKIRDAHMKKAEERRAAEAAAASEDTSVPTEAAAAPDASDKSDTKDA